MTTPKLKPCRECGRRDEIVRSYEAGIFTIKCFNCGHGEAARTRKAVESAWNRRAAAKEK